MTIKNSTFGDLTVAATLCSVSWKPAAEAVDAHIMAEEQRAAATVSSPKVEFLIVITIFITRDQRRTQGKTVAINLQVFRQHFFPIR